MTTNPAIVTGASGWLGRSLVAALNTGLPEVPALATAPQRPVRCLVMDRKERAAVAGYNPEASCVEGDLRRSDSLSQRSNI